MLSNLIFASLLFAWRVLLSGPPGLIISFIIIFLIKKLVKPTRHKKLIYVSIITICVGVSVVLLSPFVNDFFYGTEETNDLYKEMTEKSEKLMGLSKGEVVELLGNPICEYRDGNQYEYRAGAKYRSGILLHDRQSYVLMICFDDNGKVNDTFLKEVD